MARTTQLLTTFNAGEWSPTLWARGDLAKYNNACRRLENFIPLTEGPATRRPGTRFVAETKNSGAVRLLRFEFSTTQAYVIEAGENYFRFYKDRGRIELNGDAYEVATPYRAGDLARLKYTQSADVMYLVHPDYPPMKLSRTGHTAWSLVPVTTQDGPYIDTNLSEIYLTPSGVTGTVTLTASAAIFDPGHVGAYWSLSEPSGSRPYPKWTAGEAVQVGYVREFAGRVYQAVNAGNANTQPPIHDAGTASDGVVSWTYLHNGTGYVRVTAYLSPTQVSAQVIARLPSTAATRRWREGAWSTFRGYPSCVSFYEERLCFAATRFQPQTFWASVSGDYENFAPLSSDGRVTDDAALTFTISDDRVNAVRWLSAGRVLFMGTTGGENTVKATNLNEALTPANITVKRETTTGSADLAPARINDTVLFVQRAGRKLFEMNYAYDADAFQAPEVTLLARHLTQTGLVDITYQQEPWSILWCVCADGSLIALTYLRLQDVTAWHRHPLGGDGKVRSVTVIPGFSQDELWLATERIIDGEVRRYVEFMEEQFVSGAPVSESLEPGRGPTQKHHAFFVDCGLSYRGSPVTSVSGLDHLEGMKVQILADGATHPDRIVSRGRIILDRPAGVIHVGLGYVSLLETLNLDAASPDGIGIGKPKRIYKAAIRFTDTLGAEIGAAGAVLEPVAFRDGSAPMDDSPPLFTGDKNVLFPRGWDNEIRLIVQQQDPLPCTILGIVLRIATNDG